MRGLDLAEEHGDVHSAVLRRERPEPPGGLLQLPLEAGAIPAPGLIPRDDDVHEPLEEILLGRVGRAPRVLERLVRGEVLALAREGEPPVQVRFRL